MTRSMEDQDRLDVEIAYRDQSLSVTVPRDATIRDLAAECASSIGATVERVSLFVLPKPGMLKHPFPERQVADVVTATSRIKLIGTPSAEVQRLDETAQAAARVAVRRDGRAVGSSRGLPRRNRPAPSRYGFRSIRPLSYLPNPERSQRFLERLADDPGIQASMRRHQFSVGLLTEMNPVEYTTHESRTLGLNRNRGEVIELRLRTDRYDGYRDYKVIRKTLCHELSHNVWGDHDRNFWDLTKQIEDEVDRNDWKHHGHRLSAAEFYNPGDDAAGGAVADHGVWTGGEYVLGRSSDGPASAATTDTEGLSRREIMARAATSRMDREQQDDDDRRRVTEEDNEDGKKAVEERTGDESPSHP